MKRKILFLLLPALLLASCSSDEETAPPNLPEGRSGITFEIGFAADDNTMTRAATAPNFKTTWEEDDEIGLFIVQGNGGMEASGNYVDNMKLTYNGSTWAYTLPVGKEFYPSATDQLHFYAYYPYESGIDPTAYTFGVKADQSAETDYNKSDLMLAQKENVGISKDAVQLKFYHALALVQIEVKREVNVPHFEENDFTVTLKGAKPDATLGWSSDLTATGTPTDIVMHKVADMPYTYRALVPAQALTIDSKVAFVQTSSGKEIDMEYHGIKSAALTAKNTHKYGVTLGWGIDPDYTYDVGDVYPHVGPAMGIVFWLDPTSGGKHGKVIGLKENPITLQWSTENIATGATDVSNGRLNMAIINTFVFSDYPAFEWVHSLNCSSEDYSNPDATGVWYLPAKNELKALYAGYSGKVYEDISGWYDYSDMPGYGDASCATARTTFNLKLKAANGVELMNRWYWSSSESAPKVAWGVALDSGLPNSTNSKSSFDRARCVLAF